MNCRRLFQLALLTQICMFAFTHVAKADEPLSMKIELRHGINGPRKSATAAPGEVVFYAVTVTGLTADDSGKLKFNVSGEVRSEDGELLHAFPDVDYDRKSVLGSPRQMFRAGYMIPEDYPAKTIKQIFVLRDLNSRKEFKQDLSIEVKQPTAPFPFQVGYWLNDERNIEHSGKYTTGDFALVKFVIGEVKAAKSINCNVEFFRKGESKAADQKQFKAEVSKANRSANRLPMYFEFSACEPFDGFIRLTTTDDAMKSNSVEIPIVITEALGSEGTSFLAERPLAGSASTKKE